MDASLEMLAGVVASVHDERTPGASSASSRSPMSSDATTTTTTTTTTTNTTTTATMAATTTTAAAAAAATAAAAAAVAPNASADVKTSGVREPAAVPPTKRIKSQFGRNSQGLQASQTKKVSRENSNEKELVHKLPVKSKTPSRGTTHSQSSSKERSENQRRAHEPRSTRTKLQNPQEELLTTSYVVQNPNAPAQQVSSSQAFSIQNNVVQENPGFNPPQHSRQLSMNMPSKPLQLQNSTSQPPARTLADLSLTSPSVLHHHQTTNPSDAGQSYSYGLVGSGTSLPAASQPLLHDLRSHCDLLETGDRQLSNTDLVPSADQANFTHHHWNAHESTMNHHAHKPSSPNSVRQNSRGSVETGGSEGEKDVDSDKRALRAERNRQSAAASRERKKRHIKDLESRVRYLSDITAALQHRAHVDKQEWLAKEQALIEENNSLRAQLADGHAHRGQRSPSTIASLAETDATSPSKNSHHSQLKGRTHPLTHMPRAGEMNTSAQQRYALPQPQPQPHCQSQPPSHLHPAMSPSPNSVSGHSQFSRKEASTAQQSPHTPSHFAHSSTKSIQAPGIESQSLQTPPLALPHPNVFSQYHQSQNYPQYRQQPPHTPAASMQTASHKTC